jgi:hypothetical protein
LIRLKNLKRELSCSLLLDIFNYTISKSKNYKLLFS